MSEAEARDRAALAGPPAGDLLDTPEAGPTVIRGGVLRAGGYILGIALTVASTPLLIRHLGVVDYGRYLTVVSLIFIVAGVTEAGLTNIGVREYTERDADGRRAVVGNLVGLRISLTVVGVVCATAFAVVAGYDSAQVLGCLLAGAGLVLTVMQASYVVPLSSQLRLGWVTVAELVRQVLTVVGIVALVVAGASLAPFFALPIVAGAGALAFTVWVLHGDVRLRPSFARREWWALVRDALPYAAATALGIVYFRVTVVLMSLVASDTEVGYFSASFRIIEVLAGVPWLLATSVFPILVRAARDDRERLRYALQRLVEVATIVGVWVSFALGLAAPFAIEVIAGPKFEPAVDVLRIQAATMLGSFTMATLGFVLLSLRRHRELLMANLLALAVATGLTLGLAPAHGAKGAAVATVATEFVLAGAYGLVLRVRHPELRISLRFLGPLSLAVAVAVVPVVALGLPAIVAACVASIIYFAVLLALHAIPPEVGEAFADRLRARRRGD
jgi:O-antigen/teichoic acid export membrane protein